MAIVQMDSNTASVSNTSARVSQFPTEKQLWANAINNFIFMLKFIFQTFDWSSQETGTTFVSDIHTLVPHH